MGSNNSDGENNYLRQQGPVLLLTLIAVAVVALAYREIRVVSTRVDELSTSNAELQEQLTSFESELMRALKAPPPGRRGGPGRPDGPPGRGPDGPSRGGPDDIQEGPSREGDPRGSDWSECTGEVPQETVDRLLADNSAPFRQCYLDAGGNVDEIEGLVIELKVDASGNMEEARIGSTAENRELFDCMMGLVSRLSFGAPSGGQCAVVRMPFDFAG